MRCDAIECDASVGMRSEMMHSTTSVIHFNTHVRMQFIAAMTSYRMDENSYGI